MPEEQKTELAAIASILRSWGRVHRERAAATDDEGYGISDPFTGRVADELAGLADRIDGVLANLA